MAASSIKTGAWPEGSVFMLEVRRGATKGSINKRGQFQTGVLGTEAHVKDKRFKSDAWNQPVFDWIRQTYLLLADHMLKSVDALEGVEAKQKEQLRFAARGFVDAMSPSNFAFTNPDVIQKTIETRGENLLTGLRNMLADIGRGQLTHTDNAAFEGEAVVVAPLEHRQDIVARLHFDIDLHAELHVRLGEVPGRQ